MIEECLVIELLVRGDSCPLAEASTGVGAVINCQPPQHRNDGYRGLQFSVNETDSEVSAILEADDRIKYLHISEVNEMTNYRCLAAGTCVVQDLINVGLLVDAIRYSNGNERIKGAVVGYDNLKLLLNRVNEHETNVSIQLITIHLLRQFDEVPISSKWNITPPQQKAIRTALQMGYFQTPKKVTAEEVGEHLGISKSAFLRRLHRAQRQLFNDIFETEGGSPEAR